MKNTINLNIAVHDSQPGKGCITTCLAVDLNDNVNIILDKLQDLNCLRYSKTYYEIGFVISGDNTIQFDDKRTLVEISVTQDCAAIVQLNARAKSDIFITKQFNNTMQYPDVKIKQNNICCFLESKHLYFGTVGFFAIGIGLISFGIENTEILECSDIIFGIGCIAVIFSMIMGLSLISKECCWR